MKKDFERHGCIVGVILTVLSILIIQLFPVSASYAAEVRFYDSKERTHYFVDVPGRRNMKVGAFEVVVGEYVSDGRIRNKKTRKAGVLVNDSILYYVEASQYGKGRYPDDPAKYFGTFDPAGEMHYAVWKDYLIMDSWGYGEDVTYNNRIMYLFKLGKDSVKLLDVVYVGTFEFISAIPGYDVRRLLEFPEHTLQAELEDSDHKESFGNTYKEIKTEHEKEQLAAYKVKVEDVLTPGRLDTIMDFVIMSVMLQGGSPGYDDETLVRDASDYSKVWRVKRDGGIRGFFESP